MRERYTIIRRNQNCDCIRFPYGLGTGFCGRPVIEYWKGRNPKIHSTTCLTNLDKEAVRIMQAIVLIEATERNGYAISGGSIHRDSSSEDDACSRPRWMENDRS
jgi:hypothetical protein